MIERTVCVLLVGWAAEQSRAGCIHGSDENDRKILSLAGFQCRCAVLRDEGRMSQGRAGSQHFCAAHNRARVRLSHNMEEDIGNLVYRPIPIDWRID